MKRAKTSSATTPFLLSECLAPVPAKLVDKIVRGDYVDMAELLRDNKLLRRRGGGRGTPRPPAHTPSTHTGGRCPIFYRGSSALGYMPASWPVISQRGFAS